MDVAAAQLCAMGSKESLPALHARGDLVVHLTDSCEIQSWVSNKLALVIALAKRPSPSKSRPLTTSSAF